MAKYGNENAAAGGRSSSTADRDRSYGGGADSRGGNRGGRSPGLAGNATVADHMLATGRISAPSIPQGGVARGNFATQDDAYNNYAKAVGDYATRGFFDKALDFLAGPFYDQREPMAANARSFAGGTFHSSTNPGGVFGSLMGLAAPGTGMIVGPTLASLYDAAGLPDIWHGGYDQPDLRGGLFGAGPMAASTASAAGGPDLARGGTGNAGRAGLAQGPMAPRFGQITPAAPAAPAAPQTAMAVTPGRYLSVPGPSPYGLMAPGYRYAA